MRVLVTGGAGFIGSHTVDGLLARGHTVRILDALRPPVHEGLHVPVYVPVNDAEFILGDVRDPVQLENAVKGVDVVFHLAAYQDYLPDFSTFFQTNTVSTAALYEAIVAKRLPIKKVIVASSQAVYGEGKYVCNNCRLSGEHDDGMRYPSLREDRRLRDGHWDLDCPKCGETLEPELTDEAKVNPSNQYAVSKYTQELVALTLGRRYDIPTVCLRYSIVQGARQSFRNAYSGILRIFTQRILHGKIPVCYEDGHQLRDYVSAHDVMQANLLVMEDARADFGVFNVGGDRAVSVLAYARLVADRAGVTREPEIPGLYRYGDTRHIMSEVSKIKQLGWRPQITLGQIIDEYLEWAPAQPGFRDYSQEAEARMESLGTIRRAASNGVFRK